MPRSNYNLPLTLTLLFGLALSLIASGPVFGDNVPGCQGISPASTASVILAGRIITPSTILRATNGQPCLAAETGLNLVNMIRTVVVSPNGTPSQNGSALLAAMNTISNSNPSASNPWLLKLEPGNYDLGNSALVLKSFVDLEGSGEETTIISSTINTNTIPATTGTLVVASNSAVRFVQIANTGAGTYQVAAFIPIGITNVHFSHTIVNTSGGSLSNALFNAGGSVNIQFSTITASGGSSGSFGIINYNGVSVTAVQNSTVTASGTSPNYGVDNFNGNSTIQASTVTASGNATSNFGLEVLAGFVAVQNSTLYGNGTNVSQSMGLRIAGGTASAQNSVILAAGGATSYGLYNGGGSVKIAGSQLSGFNASFGLTVCPFSYHTDFSPLNSSCQ